MLSSIKLKDGVLGYIRPFVITFLGTAASGFTYVGMMLTLLMFGGKNAPAFVALMSVVLVTALANSILVSVLYFPLKSTLGRQR
ncbi:MAG TPA: hypothetical protein PLC07_03600 [Bacillota bacterium]|nr:hypothetical protein [Bacillota bacterium]HPT86619.1 hypothetical protein [Bacillota bacterium]